MSNKVRLFSLAAIVALGLTIPSVTVYATQEIPAAQEEVLPTEPATSNLPATSIESADQLIDLLIYINETEDAVAQDYTLVADIIVTSGQLSARGLDEKWSGIGSDSDHPFSEGSFDGNSYTVILPRGSAGLFGYAKNTTIKNVTVKADSIETDCGGAIGAVVAHLSGGTLENCGNLASVSNYTSAEFAGGIAGYAENSSIVGCWNGGTVFGGHTKAEIKVETATDHETVTGDFTGGIVGNLAGTNDVGIQECFNYSQISGANVGGIAGIISDANIRDCFNTGRIAGSGDTRFTGGISAIVWNVSLEFCYQAGYLTGNGESTVGTLYAHAIDNASYGAECCFDNRFSHSSGWGLGGRKSALEMTSEEIMSGSNKWSYIPGMYPQLTRMLNTEPSVVATAAAVVREDAKVLELSYVDTDPDVDSEAKWSTMSVNPIAYGASITLPEDSLMFTLNGMSRLVPVANVTSGTYTVLGVKQTQEESDFTITATRTEKDGSKTSVVQEDIDVAQGGTVQEYNPYTRNNYSLNYGYQIDFLIQSNVGNQFEWYIANVETPHITPESLPELKADSFQDICAESTAASDGSKVGFSGVVTHYPTQPTTDGSVPVAQYESYVLRAIDTETYSYWEIPLSFYIHKSNLEAELMINGNKNGEGLQLAYDKSVPEIVCNVYAGNQLVDFTDLETPLTYELKVDLAGKNTVGVIDAPLADAGEYHVYWEFPGNEYFYVKNEECSYVIHQKNFQEDIIKKNYVLTDMVELEKPMTLTSENIKTGLKKNILVYDRTIQDTTKQLLTEGEDYTVSYASIAGAAEDGYSYTYKDVIEAPGGYQIKIEGIHNYTNTVFMQFYVYAEDVEVYYKAGEAYQFGEDPSQKWIYDKQPQIQYIGKKLFYVPRDGYYRVQKVTTEGQVAN